MNNVTTIVLTGAHVTPAVAFTQAFLRKIPAACVVYVGRTIDATEPASIEQSEIERVGGQFRMITSGKFHRFATWSQLSEMGKIPRGFLQAFLLLRKERPQAVLSFGGYLSVPLVMAATLLHIPAIIHEQTTRWGLANRICRPFASAVAVSWPQMEEQGVVLTGNPMPEEIVNAGKQSRSRSKKKMLYITEGSQASRAISQVVGEAMGTFLQEFDKVYHQTKYPASGISSPRYYTARWFSTPEHADLLARASLSISRSGANTVTYNAYMGLPSIFIPLPHAGEQEQLHNAELLSGVGLARIIPQPELSQDRLLSEVRSLSSLSESVLRGNQKKAKELIYPEAASTLADVVLSAASQR